MKRQKDVVPPDAIALRHHLLHMDGRRVDADAVERGRLPKAVCPVECDGQVARLLQFGNERERQKFAAAEGEAEIVVEKDFLHLEPPVPRRASARRK